MKKFKVLKSSKFFVSIAFLVIIALIVYMGIDVEGRQQDSRNQERQADIISIGETIISSKNSLELIENLPAIESNSDPSLDDISNCVNYNTIKTLKFNTLLKNENYYICSSLNRKYFFVFSKNMEPGVLKNSDKFYFREF